MYMYNEAHMFLYRLDSLVAINPRLQGLLYRILVWRMVCQTGGIKICSRLWQLAFTGSIQLLVHMQLQLQLQLELQMRQLMTLVASAVGDFTRAALQLCMPAATATTYILRTANCRLQVDVNGNANIYIYIYMLSGSRVGGTFTCMSCENNDRVVGKGVFIKPFCQKKS